MTVKIYENLPEDAVRIRRQVFMEEQGFENELDEIDAIASHIVMYCDTAAIATCRVFDDPDGKGYILGRLAVSLPYRGQNIGTEMLKEAEKLVQRKGGSSLSLHAQCRAKAFYQKAGYREFGDIEYDEGCPHIWMRKHLNEI